MRIGVSLGIWEKPSKNDQFSYYGGRRATGEFSSYHVHEIGTRKGDRPFCPHSFETHQEQHLILYFETESGAQIPHSLSEV